MKTNKTSWFATVHFTTILIFHHDFKLCDTSCISLNSFFNVYGWFGPKEFWKP